MTDFEIHAKDTKMQVNSSSPSAPLTNTISGAHSNPHTNVVIEAGNIRGKDEVALYSYLRVAMS
jgi:hypothetical protein